MRATVFLSLERTARDLLSLVCDAVFLVDEHLHLKEPSLDLAALLLRSHQRSLCGHSFMEMIDVQDQAPFRHFLAKSSDKAQCCSLHLQDSSGAQLTVQLFHRSLELEGQLCHLIGVKEEPECTTAVLPRSSDASNGLQFSSDSSTDSSGGEMEVAEYITIDVASTDWTLLACSTNFTSICGPRCSEGVRSWFRERDFGVISDWLQESTASLLMGHTPHKFRNARFKTVHSQASGGWKATMTATSLSVDKLPLRIGLSNLRPAASRNAGHLSTRHTTIGTPRRRGRVHVHL